MTRGSSVFAAECAARHPQANDAFKAGLTSVFRQWTALELAVVHEWGGPSSAERAEALVTDVHSMFFGREKIYKDVRFSPKKIPSFLNPYL